MAIDDDIAASLPPPPPAAPARRDAAIEMALRRFDGTDDPDPVRPQPRHNEGPVPWWAPLARPQAGALFSIALVALIGLPVAWISLDRSPDRGSASRELAVSEQALATEKMAAPSTPDINASALATNGVAPPSTDAPTPITTSATRIELAQVESLPPPAAPPPPAAAALPEKTEAPSVSREAPAELAARAPQGIVVSGSRARSSSLAAAPAMQADAEEMADSSIVVTAARAVVGDRRGDWNACTVDDPMRRISDCRGLVNPAADGANGRAAAQVSDGLALAWKGDLDGAITAFDRAIAIAPRSAFAYLNRAITHRRQGRLDRALADADRAVRYAPDAARGYYQRSLVLRAHGQAQRASADEDRAADLDPRYAILLNRR